MIDCLYIAWRYVCSQKLKTTILVGSLTLIILLPLALNALVNEGAEQLRSRAAVTPIVLGARGSPLELVLSTLYFQSKSPPIMRMSEVERVRNSALGEVVPVYVHFNARGQPIVATTIEYFSFRGLRIVSGRNLAMLGECVLGATVAAQLQLKPGDTLLSTSENAFDLAGAYPLKMHVVGVLAATGTPDDEGVFVDLKTAWIIEGIGHGHQDVTRPESAGVLLSRDDNRVTVNAAVTQFTEITAENVDSFHFHGDASHYPITAIVVIPNDEKSGTLLQGRYLSDSDVTQAIRPAAVMDDLLSTILKVRSFMIAGSLLVSVSTIVTAILVFLLSLRLRRREIETLKKIGSSPLRIGVIVTWEILMVVAISGAAAAACTLFVMRYSQNLIQWFIL